MKFFKLFPLFLMALSLSFATGLAPRVLACDHNTPEGKEGDCPDCHKHCKRKKHKKSEGTAEKAEKSENAPAPKDEKHE